MQYKSPKLPIHGWLNIDKPIGYSSAKVVAAVKRITGAKKVGHAGTLDPLASGVLPIALGEATKTVHFMRDADKEYRFILQCGETRDTGDAEGDVIETSTNHPTKDDILSAIPHFLGTITQVPPKYSAIKIDGQRAYDLARKGQQIDMPSREVTISSLELIDQPSESSFLFHTRCSKGTYIRSLAQDIAQHCQSCGYVSKLIRTEVENFSLKTTVSLEKLEKIVHLAPATKENNYTFEHLLPVETVLDDIPVLPINEFSARSLMNGKAISLPSGNVKILDNQHLAVFFDETLVAIVEKQNDVLQPVRVFNLLTFM